MTQNDLRTSVVILSRTFDFKHSAFELLNVAHFFQIVWEHDDGKGTRLVVLAKGEEGDAVGALCHVQHGSADALGSAHMLARFGEGDAVMFGSIWKYCVRSKCRSL